MRMVVRPVSANFTGTFSPTVRWSELAVDVSTSRSPVARAAELPAVMFRITVFDRFLVPRPRMLSSEFRNSNWPP